jgi:DNA-binding transcriptional LysR family regulator
MTAQQLRDLIAVLAHGGFRPAARALSVSQAGLTKSLARLEQECGFALLSRTSAGVALTPQGAGFLPHAQAVLHELERAEDWVREAGRKRPRSVALGVSIEPSLRLAPAVLADYRRALPEVTVHVTQGDPGALLAGLRDHRLDLAVLRLPARGLDGDLHVDVLYDSPAAIVARADHPLRRARSVDDLAQAQWVVVGDPSRPGADDASIRELFLERRLGQPRIAAVCDSLFGAVSLLMDSDFVARLPRAILAHRLVAGVLAEIPVREQAERAYEIALVRKASRRTSREAQTLAAMLKSFARIRPGA